MAFSLTRFIIHIVAALACCMPFTGRAQAFVHPGCLSTTNDFARMKAKVQASAQPWLGSYNRLATSGTSHAQPNLIRGGTGENYQFAYFDSAGTYQLSLRWHVTGNNAYADNAVSILNAWANTCTNLGGDPNSALLSLYGYQFACAAENLRTYTNWAAADFAKFQGWMTNLWYPHASYFLSTHYGQCSTHHWANWDLCTINTILAIGVLCDRRDIYNEAINFYKFGAGAGSAGEVMSHSFPGYLGQCQESGRDQGHCTLDPILLGTFCEIAWNQGDDMYAYNTNTLLQVSEYVTRYNVQPFGPDLPYVVYMNCNYYDPSKESGGIKPTLASGSRGSIRPGWSLIYNHYVNRRGLSAPWTGVMVAQVNPEGGGGDYGSGGGYDQLGFTTLTHTLDPIAPSATPAPSSLWPQARNNTVTLSWFGSAAATSYNIKRAAAPAGPYTTVGSVDGSTQSYTDFGLIQGSNYFYAVSAIVNGGETTNSTPVSATPNLLLAGTIIGSTGSYQSAGADKRCLFDGSLRNFYDADSGTGDWAGLDLIQSNVITGVAYAPRPGFSGRMVGGQFQGCNVADFSSGVTTLFTVSSGPGSGVLTYQSISNPGKFRYVRYIGPTSSSCNAAEIQFFGYAGVGPLAPGIVQASGGNAQVQLSWTPPLTATSYNLKRSTTAGGPYALLAGSLVATNYTDTAVTNGVTYYYVVSAVNGNGEGANSLQASATPSAPSQLEAHLKFDETSGTTAADSTGNGNDGALKSGATWVPGILGNAVALDATTNGYVTLPAGVVSGLTNFSVTAWVKVDTNATWARVFDFGSSTTSYMFLAPSSGTSVRFSITTSGGGAEQRITNNAVLSTGVWHHLAVTLAGNVGVLHIDGAPAGTNSNMTLNPSSLGSTTQNYIGKSQYVDPYLDGSIDDFRIYNRALNSSEVLTLALMPSTPAGLAATPGNAQVALNWKAATNAISYNLKRALASGGPYTTVTNLTGTNCIDAGLVNLTTYYYVVSAVTARGQSPDSSEANATPYSSAPAAPLSLSAAGLYSQVRLGWSAVAGATGYNIKRSTTSGSGYALLGSSTATNYTDLNVTNGVTYYYVVSATNGLGESSNSSQAAATPQATFLTWSGASNPSWDFATTNWLSGGAGARYQDGVAVRFDDSGNNPAISLAAPMSPALVIVSNVSDAYSFDGFAISGAGKLIKQGSGTLTLNAANAFSGGVVISNGTVAVADNGALGSGTATLAGGTLQSAAALSYLGNDIIAPVGTSSTIDTAAGSDMTLGGGLSGGGAITRGSTGTSSLTLSGNNSGFSGTFTIPANADAIVRFAGANAGSANAAWVFNNTTAARQTLNSSFGSSIQFGSFTGGGEFRNNGSFTNTLQVGALGLNDTWDGELSANGVISLVKVGAGQMTLTGTNAGLNGTITVKGGELVLYPSYAGLAGVTVTNGGAFTPASLASGVSLAVSNLTFQTGGIVKFSTVINSGVSLLAASNVTVSGISTIRITQTNGLAVGSYPLISYAGTFSGVFSNLKVELPSSVTNQVVGTLVNSSHQITLSITANPIPPSTPTDLTAIDGPGCVILNWTAALGASSYNIKRATVSGGPYAVIATSTLTTFTNTGLLNTLYYYVVSASNAFGESADSAEAAAAPIPLTARISKADNAINLNLGTSWIGGVAPNSNAVAVWNNTVTTPNSVALGGNLSWNGLSISNPAGPVTITAGNTLTLGGSGIDMSVASQDLTLSSSLTLGAGNQAWIVGGGRTLTLNTGTFTRSTGPTLNVQGAGTVAAGMAGLANDASGIAGPWATVGTGANTYHATLSAGNVVGYTGYTSGVASGFPNPGAGTLNYNITNGVASQTYAAASRTMNTLRNAAGASTITFGDANNNSRYLIVNGILNAGTGTVTVNAYNGTCGIQIGANNNRELVVNAANASISLDRIIDNGGGASALTTISSGANTVTLTATNPFTGGTTVNGGTLNLAAGGGAGTIRGALTINPGATVNATVADALGYSVGTTATPINIVAGTLDNTVSGNQAFRSTFNLAGGTMSSSGGGAYHFNGSAGAINSLASSTVSTISAPVVLRADGLTITTARGSVPSGTDLLISGAISQSATGFGIAKAGAGVLQLSGANTYSGTTAVNAGTLLVNNTSGSGTGSGAVTVAGGATLGGSGIITGAVTVNAGGTLAPGMGSIGTLTVNNTVTLSGKTVMEINRTGAASDMLAANTINGGGSLIVTNLGPALVAGDSFTLFSRPVSGFASVTLPALSAGLGWVTNLSANATISVINIGPAGPATLTNIVTGSTLTLSWPAGEGWRLQGQTNPPASGLGTNWTDIPVAPSTNQMTMPIITTNGSVFYRLIYP